MATFPDPIFRSQLGTINWTKIYSREYGVQYSEMALLCLAYRASYHIPCPSVTQIVVPEANNTAFYIDASSWKALVASLNQAYTNHLDKLESYESDFINDGEAYLAVTQKIAKLNLPDLSNDELLVFYREYQEKLFRYSIFAWTAFILNNYVADRATSILEGYLAKKGMQTQKQDILDALFKPQKKTAVLELQDELAKCHSKPTEAQFETLYEKYRWLSCLDIHNHPWSRDDFWEMIQTSSKKTSREQTDFATYAHQLELTKQDADFFDIARRFVYIKDARDDYRRQGVYLALPFFAELAQRMNLDRKDFGYVLEAEAVGFLEGKPTIDKTIIDQRKQAFVLYLDENEKPVCLHGADIPLALQTFGLTTSSSEQAEIKGTIASQGKASGKVAIVRGIEDLKKVKQGSILVAVTTHPDYVPAMRRSVAIVTDEGGITSHAAIVSREFGLPCIVGTKNATSLLTDGELVEVDAFKGILKK